jgi:hypothetical protein
MASEVKTNKVSPATGTTLSVGDSGDTLALATDAVTGFNVGSDAAGDVLYNDGTDYTRLAKPGTPADEVLTFATGATAPSWVAAAGGLFSAFAIFVDQKTAGTDGGTFTLGAWRTRDLNTTISNTDTTNITLGTNQFTLLAGNYLIQWSAPNYSVGANITRLYDVTGTASVVGGTTAISNRSLGYVRVTPGSSNIYSIEHRCDTTNTGNGFGVSANLSVEQYTMVVIFKES